MKKLLLFVMLTGFLTVSAQYASMDFSVKSPYYNFANDVKSDIVPIDGWNLSKLIIPPVEYREFIIVNRYDGKSGIIPVEGWNLSKINIQQGEQRGFVTVDPHNGKSDIIPVKGWNLSKMVVPTGVNR